MKVGDLVKFDRINGHTRDINDKVALYLGEAFIHRYDGDVIQNHKVLLLGESTPRIIDVGLLRWMRRYPE
tara:strand:+ start:2655 stop:2864 length:210 start_codon:yes stop_codon:yes gene_type:complete